MHKGSDTIRLMTKDLYADLVAAGMDMNDDVTRFQVFRYLSAGEAFCRIFGYNLSQSSVGCTKLTVHLEGMDWVGDGAAQEAATVSTLLQYFARPPELAALRYLEYFSKFNVAKASAAERVAAAGAGGERVVPQRGNAYSVDAIGNKVSVRRPGSLHVARMYPVSVTMGEQYYLRMLLGSVAGVSFADLRTAGGQLWDTYRQAAEARGLLTVEREFTEGLGHVAQGLGSGLSTVGDIRHTFAMMAVSGGDGVPVLQLYNEFRYLMALDIDVSGAISPPGRDRGAVYVRLPVLEYEEGVEHSLEAHPLHEYHLLRLLEGLLERNFSRTLEDLGLKSLAVFAAARREGAAAPHLQQTLERLLYVLPGAVAPGPPAELQQLRAVYVRDYPHLLTGQHLPRLLLGAEQQGSLAYEAAFFKDMDLAKEEESFQDMYATLNSEQKEFVDRAVRALRHQVARMEALKNGDPPPVIPDDERFLHLQARGGRGKSYILRCIISKALALGVIPSVSSFAGVAAVLLPLGATSHKVYGLALETADFVPSTLTTRSAQGNHLALCGLHIIDEADCLHKNLFRAASEVTTRCHRDKFGGDSDLPFGGAMVILSADKHQSLPITKVSARPGPSLPPPPPHRCRQ